MMLVTHSNEQGDGQGEFVIRIPTLDKRFSVESEEEGKRMALNVIKESGYTGQVTFVRRDGRTYEIEIKPELLVVSKTFWTMVADLKTARSTAETYAQMHRKRTLVIDLNQGKVVHDIYKEMV